jgi:hypothetical protein
VLTAHRFPSATHDHVTHVANIDTETGETWCSCPGFEYSQRCWHTVTLTEHRAEIHRAWGMVPGAVLDALQAVEFTEVTK